MSIIFVSNKIHIPLSNPTKTVLWGQQTWEEMMIGFVEYYVER